MPARICAKRIEERGRNGEAGNVDLAFLERLEALYDASFLGPGRDDVVVLDVGVSPSAPDGAPPPSPEEVAEQVMQILTNPSL